MPRPSIIGTPSGTGATTAAFIDVTMTVPAGADVLCVAFGGYTTDPRSVVSVQGDPDGTPFDLNDVTLFSNRTPATQYAGLYALYSPTAGATTVRITLNSGGQLKACIFCLTDVDIAGTPLNGSVGSGEGASSTVSMVLTSASSSNALNVASTATYSANTSSPLGDNTTIYSDQNGGSSSSLYVWHEDGTGTTDTVESNGSVDWAGVAASFEGTGGAGAELATDFTATGILTGDVTQAGDALASDFSATGLLTADITVTGGAAQLATTLTATGTLTAALPLSVPIGWETVVYTGPAPNPTTTESFYEYAQTDTEVGSFTMAVNDVLLFESQTGLTVDGQTLVYIDPAADVSGGYKIYDDSAGVFTPTSSYSITDEGVFYYLAADFTATGATTADLGVAGGAAALASTLSGTGTVLATLIMFADQLVAGLTGIGSLIANLVMTADQVSSDLVASGTLSASLSVPADQLLATLTGNGLLAADLFIETEGMQAVLGSSGTLAADLDPITDELFSSLNGTGTVRATLRLTGEAIEPAYYDNGLPYDADGTLAIEDGGVVVRIDQGRPFTNIGRIAAAVNGTVSYINQGRPYSSSGQLVYGTGAVVRVHAGIPFAADNRLALSA